MKSKITIVTAFLMSIALAVYPEAQQSQFHQPMSPIAPTSEDECRALANAWSNLCQQIRDTHEQCLKANDNPRIKGAGSCSKAPCLSIHEEMERCGGAEERSAVDACYASVRAHKDREAESRRAQEAAEQERQRRMQQMQRESEQMQNAYAEAQKQRMEATRRAVEEQQRAAAEAERQRHEASQRAVNDAMRDLMSSRDRAQEYNAKAAASGNSRNVPLTSRDQQTLDSIRNQAEANNLRPRYVPAAPSGYTATSTSALSGAVANLLGAEVQTILKWGLNQTEAGGYLVQMFDTAGDYDAKYRSFVSSVDYVRKAWNGTTSYEEDVAAVGGTVSVLSGFAFRGTPAISIQLDRVFRSVSGIHAVELDRLELLIASLDRPLTDEERRRLSDARAVQALYAPFIPLDRLHRLEAVANETSRVHDADNRGFFDRMGR